ncbi:unnamed protein product [Caenorhabditis angaria]|uniref:Serpentine receptor class gamma n=1 Tax=Caenorhabditis angaria TaxID=860376 RepID=A0A9P1IEP9_9PELO|nr:unnamed protein product [Caenorhabditis angaria]
MSTNSSNFFDSYPIECDVSYDPLLEFLKFFLQAIYLLPGSLIILKLLYIILFAQRSKYKNNYFFRFYVLDLLASFYNSFSDLIFGRFFIYITPLCGIIAPFFYDFSIFLQISNNLYNYCRALKSVTQILLTTNRMTCVMFPIFHQKIWKTSFKIVVSITLILPFFAIWNLIISRNYITETFGGFHVNHKNAISWASLSKFQLAFISVALVFTFLNTGYATCSIGHRTFDAIRTDPTTGKTATVTLQAGSYCECRATSQSSIQSLVSGAGISGVYNPKIIG